MIVVRIVRRRARWKRNTRVESIPGSEPLFVHETEMMDMSAGIDRATPLTAAVIETGAGELESLQNVTFLVTGMTCASCVRRVEKALGNRPGVASANVILATEQATVAFDPSKTSLDQLRM